MYPREIIFGLHLYEIMIGLGFFMCLLYYRRNADRLRFPRRVQNLCIIGAVAGVICGGGCAILFQAFYNYLESGTFEIVSSTGATFFGGLIGGIASFLLVYFVIGEYWILQRGEARQYFRMVSEIAAGCIALAHGFGRLGCLFAGCCHGAHTTAWYGIYNEQVGAKTVPTQLIEAVFLFALFFFLNDRLKKQKKGNISIYLVAYSFFRFFLEYLRDDDRGGGLVSFWSPSQLIAVIAFAVGAGLMLLEAHWEEKKTADAKPEESAKNVANNEATSESQDDQNI